MSESHQHSAALSQRVKTLIAALEARSVLTESQLDATVETFLAHAKPANAFAMVARAWIDPAYKLRLLSDASAAALELGITLAQWASVRLRAVENTDEMHNVIVCTLCSCYPLALLGPSPAWYKSEAYRAKAVSDPRGVLREFGVHLPERQQITVWDSTADVRYFVIPARPPGSEAMNEEQLRALPTRNGLIGTALL